MKTLERYVFGSFFTSFVLSFFVLSFVLTIGLMVQIAGYILDGVPLGLVGKFALVSFPETMQWTVPLGLLVSSVLVFSRLSADSEVAAMRACGVNIMSVMKWPLLFALACTVLGVVVNNEIVPRGHEIRRRLAKRISVGSGLDVLQPGRIIDDFPHVKAYFDRREGNWLYGLVVKDLREARNRDEEKDGDEDRALKSKGPKVKDSSGMIDAKGGGIERLYTASKAMVAQRGRDLLLDLHDVTIEPIDEHNPGMARASRIPVEIKDAFKDPKYKVREKDMRFWDLLKAIFRADREAEEASRDARLARLDADDDRAAAARHMKKSMRRKASELKTEFSKRFVFAFASICFVLVGAPLGIKSQRKESTIGMAVSLAVALGYYLVTILMGALDKSPDLHPWYFIWLPVVICLALAARLIPKNL